MTAPFPPTIAEAAAGLAAGDLTAAGLTELCLARIEALDGLVNAYPKVLKDEALAADTAKEAKEDAEDYARLQAWRSLVIQKYSSWDEEKVLKNLESPLDAWNEVLDDPCDEAMRQLRTARGWKRTSCSWSCNCWSTSASDWSRHDSE